MEAYAVRQCFVKGETFWSVESLASGNTLMLYSSKEKALMRCQQLIQLFKESSSRLGSVGTQLSLQQT